MKKAIYFLTICLCFASQPAFSQMADGQYTFANNEITLELTITGDGWTISSATLTNNTTRKTLTGKGIYRQANNVKWYEFQTAECNYDFDVPTDQLTLNQFDCKNGQPSVKFTLTKKISDWTGTYKNSDSGVLIITNFKDGQSFNYKMTYGGTSSCGGLELSGTAKITSKTTATAGENKEYPITLELKGNEIFFYPSCCDYMVGMECLKFFDSHFVKR